MDGSAQRGQGSGYAPSDRMERRRADMRRAGAGIFARDGIEAVGIAEIALAVGVRPSTGLYTYPRREALIHDILHSHLHDIIKVVGDTDDAHAEAAPAARLELVLRALLDALLANRNANRLIYAGFTSVPQTARDGLTYLVRLIVFRLYTILEAALPGLAATRELQAPTARALLATISDAALWFRDDGALSRADYAGLLARQTLDGVRAALAAYKAGQQGSQREPGRV